MITGTPYCAGFDEFNRCVTVYFVEDDVSTHLTFKCGGLDEARECYAMWESLIHTAIHDPANDENTDELGLDDEVEV